MGNAQRDGARRVSAGSHGSAIAVWSVLTVVGLALPALALSAYAALGIRQLLRGETMAVFLLLFATGAAGLLWWLIVVGLRAGAAGVSHEDLRAYRRGRQDGGLAASDRTAALDRWVSGGAHAELADDVLPALVDVVHGVADQLGVNRPPLILVARSLPEVVSDGALVVGAPYLAVASVDELRAEVARVLTANAQPSVRALRQARSAHTAAHLTTPGDALWVTRAFVLGRLAAGRLAGRAEALAADHARAASTASARLVGPQVAAVASARAAAVSALWPQHVAAAQRSWTDHSTAVAPLDGWPEAYAASTGAQLARPEPPRTTVAERLDWVGGQPAAVAVPPAAPASALALLAGEGVPAVVRQLDDEAAAAYLASEAVETYGQVREDEAPLPTPSELHAHAAQSPWPALGLIVGQLNALDLAMARRDLSSLALAQALDAPSTMPAVRVNAAGTRWLCGDPQGVAAIRQALAEHPRSVASLSPLEGALRGAGELAVAGEIAALRERADAVIERRVNLTGMFGIGAALRPVDLTAVERQAVVEFVADQRGVTRAWVMRAEAGDDPEFFPYVLVLKLRARDQLSGRLEPDPGVLAAVLPLVRIVHWSDMDTRRRQHLLRKVEPIWQAKVAAAV